MQYDPTALVRHTYGMTSYVVGARSRARAPTADRVVLHPRRLRSIHARFHVAHMLTSTSTARAHSHVTFARVGKLRFSLCAISTRTELMVEPDPVIFRHAVGWTPPGCSETSSTVPPAIG